MKTIEYTRTYSLFQPEYTYAVQDLLTNMRVGHVARNADNPRRWWASNKTWSGGGDLARTFSTRREAALVLRYIANGYDVALFGGYAPGTEVTR